MKTRKETEFVQITYWTCPVAEHRHKTKSVAEACISKNSAPKRPLRRWTKLELADAFESVLMGKSYREAGEPFNIGSSRMQQVFRKVNRILLQTKYRVEPFPDHNVGSISEVREHSDFWLRQLERFRSSET